MKKLSILFGCWFFALSGFSKSTFDPNPVIANFGSPLANERFKSCWDKDKKYLPDVCKIYSESCSFQNTYQTPIKINVEIPWSEDENVSVFMGLPQDYSRPQFTNKNNKKYLVLNSVPGGSHLLIFKVVKNQFTLFVDEVVKNKMEILPKEIKPFKRIIFRPEPGWLSAEQRINGELAGIDIGYLSGPESTLTSKKGPPEILLPEGTFEVKFSYYSQANDKFTYSKKIVVTKDNKDTEEIIVKRSEFRKPFRWNGDLELELEKNRLTIDKYIFDGETVKKGFAQVPEITILETAQRVDNVFEAVEGDLIFKPGMENKFSEQTKDLPAYSLYVNGECSRFYNYYEYAKFDVFENADSKSNKVGKLILVNDYIGRRLIFENTKTKEVVPYKLNIHNGICDETATYFLHYPKSVKKEWVNLGNGPWGQDGWTIVPYVPLYGGELPNFKFGDGYVSFKKKESHIYAEGFRPFANKDGDLDEEQLKFEVSEKELFDQEGKLKLEVDCDRSC